VAVVVSDLLFRNPSPSLACRAIVSLSWGFPLQ
jgi:hypothetical protein